VLWRALRGAAELFPDSKLHVGGDEVDLGCWRGSARVREWAEKQQTETPSAGSDGRGAGSRPSTRDPIEQAFAAFVSRAVGMTAAAGRAAVVWQEAFEAGADLPPTAEVEVWKWWEGRGGGPPSDDATTAEAERAWRRALAAVTAAGHRAILAAPWYLNLGRRGHADWEEMCVFDSFSPFLLQFLRERRRRKKEKENESKKKTELTFSLFPFRLKFSPLPL
jgi:hexosaminidase